MLPTSEGCGHTKGCYRVPGGCEPWDCSYFLTWSLVGSSVAFELLSKLDKDFYWSALGINDQPVMEGTSVVDCIVQQNDTKPFLIQMSVNPVGSHHSNKVLDNNMLGLVNGTLSGAYDGVHSVCKFTRLIHIDTHDKEAALVHNLNSSYYVLTGQGRLKDDGTKRKHSQDPHVSSYPLSFLNYTNSGVERSRYVAAHATLMTIAWMILASLGIVIARYMKPLWTDHMLWGKALWFQIHRVCVISALCLSFISVLIIFSGLNWVFLPPRLHPLLGMISAGLLLLNPFVALLRPAPDHSKRIIFRFVHGTIGHGAHITALVTMFFGTRECLAYSPRWSQWIVVAFFFWRLLADVILTSLACLNDNRPTVVNEQSNYERLGEQDKMSRVSLVVLLVYMAGTLCLSCTLIYTVTGPISVDHC